MSWHVRRRGCDRPGCHCGGYGYEVADAAGVVVETGEVKLAPGYGASFAAVPDAAGVPRVGSLHGASDEVLAWLAEHGPAT